MQYGIPPHLALGAFLICMNGTQITVVTSEAGGTMRLGSGNLTDRFSALTLMMALQLEQVTVLSTRAPLTVNMSPK